MARRFRSISSSIIYAARVNACTDNAKPKAFVLSLCWQGTELGALRAVVTDSIFTSKPRTWPPLQSGGFVVT
jgi:hypothetical protein